MCQIALAQVRAEKKGEARETFAAARTAAEEIKSQWTFLLGAGTEESDKANAFKTIAVAQAQSGQIEDAQETTKQIQGVKERALAQAAIATALAEKNKQKDALATLADALKAVQQIEEKEERLEVLREVALAQIHAKDTAGAQATLADARDIINERGFHSWQSAELVEKLGKITLVQQQAGDEAKALTALAETKEAIRAIADLNDGEQALAAVAVAQAQLGASTDALETAKEIRNMRTKVGALQAVAIIRASVEDYSGAHEIFLTAGQAAREAPIFHDAKIARAEVLRELARVQAQLRQFDEGWDTAQSISDPWERIHALREVAVAQMDAKDTVQAAAKLAEVRTTIETIGFASWFFQDLIEELLRIAKAQGQLGDTLAARTTLAAGLNYQPDIDEHFYKAEAMISVAFAQASTQDLKPAQKTLKSARDTAMKIEGSQQQAETLSAIATAQAKLSEFDEAWETIKSIKFDREREEATRAIVEAKAVMAVELVQGGKEDQAQQILLDAEETATSILAYLVERAKALKAVAVAQAQIGNRVKLREILDAIRKTAGFLGVGSEEQERTLEVLAEAQAEIKAFDEAWETVKSLRYRHEQARAVAAITTMAVKLAEAGEKDAAREIFTNAFQIAAAISDETEKNETLRNIAIALARADEKTEAREILLKITGQDQPKMSDADPNLRALARVLIAKELVGYVEEKEAAQQTFNYAFQAAQAAKVSEESRATWLKVIAVLQAKAGFGDEAIRTANAIQTDRNKHLPDIAAAFIEIENESKYDYFRQFLIPCSYSLDSAYKMCGLLAQVNPQQAGSLADIIC